jgi:transposase-like protein
MYVPFLLSLRNVEDLPFERDIDLYHETVRFWWNRFGPLFAADIRRQRVSRMKGSRQWKWRLDQVYANINARCTTFGGRWITRAKFWNPTSPGTATRRLPSDS